MKILLMLAVAMILTTTLTQRPAHPAAAASAAPPAAPNRSNGPGPDLIQEAVRRAVGFDRLAPLLARRR